MRVQWTSSCRPISLSLSFCVRGVMVLSTTIVYWRIEYHCEVKDVFYYSFFFLIEGWINDFISQERTKEIWCSIGSYGNFDCAQKSPPWYNQQWPEAKLFFSPCFRALYLTDISWPLLETLSTRWWWWCDAYFPSNWNVNKRRTCVVFFSIVTSIRKQSQHLICFFFSLS